MTLAALTSSPHTHSNDLTPTDLVPCAAAPSCPAPDILLLHVLLFVLLWFCLAGFLFLLLNPLVKRYKKEVRPLPCARQSCSHKRPPIHLRRNATPWHLLCLAPVSTPLPY